MSDEQTFEEILSTEIDGFLTPEDLRTLRNGEWSHGTQGEFAYAIKQCAARALDPFRGHVYPRDQWLKDENRHALLLGVKIDGLRYLAERSGHYVGHAGPEWCDSSGNWHDVWLGLEGIEDSGGTRPVAARVEVYRDDWEHPATGIARWAEYAPHRTKKGEEVLFYMWQEMDAHMLAKCAEAQALRKAFSVIGDIYTAEELARERTGEPLPAGVDASSDRIDEVNEALQGAEHNGQSSNQQPDGGGDAKADARTGASEAESVPESDDRADATHGAGEEESAPPAAPSPAEPSEDRNGQSENPSSASTISTGEGSQLNLLFARGVHEGPWTKEGLQLLAQERFGADSLEEILEDDFEDILELMQGHNQLAHRFNQAASGKAGTESLPFEEDELNGDPELEVQCQYCGAQPGEPCRKDSGEESDYYHQKRVDLAQALDGDVEKMIDIIEPALQRKEGEELYRTVERVAVQISEWDDEKWEEVVSMMEEYYEDARQEADLRRVPSFS